MELLPIFHEKSRSDPFQLILSRAETDLFRLIESRLPFDIRVGILEMIMVAVPSRLGEMFPELAIGDWSCLQTGIRAGLVQSHRIEAREHSDIRKDRGIIFAVAVTVRADILHKGNMEARAVITDSLRVLCHLAV